MWPLNIIYQSFVPAAAVIMLCMNSLATEARTTFSGNETDRQALLHFKSLITEDPSGALTSWNNTLHFCDWNGVVCDPWRQRVNVLQLNSLQLAGSISPYIANLTALTELDLIENNLRGPLPQEIGRLSRLQKLDLKANYITGEIPTNLSNCRDLQFLRLRYNEFVGNIPSELSFLSKLQLLDLYTNNITGSIPPSFGNLSSLLHITLALNGLEGSIPSDLGRLPSLQIINFYGNYISGSIPSELLNLSSLSYFLFAQNELHGSLPVDIGKALPKLLQFAGGLNHFTGSIPASLSNASELEIFDFAINELSGPMPINFGVLHNLVRLNFGDNNLETDRDDALSFITSLTNCTSLEVLGLDSNRFSGLLPDSIVNLSSHITILALGTNQLSGRFPAGIENYVNLSLLSMEDNFFTGSIPIDVGKLHALQFLYLYNNEFSGQIPLSLGNLTQLSSLRLAENHFSGSIPRNLGSCQHLELLDLSYNVLNGTIPTSVMGISALSISLNLAKNNLIGSLPDEVHNLKSLGELDLSENKLSGKIPAALGECMGLETLRLEGNLFQGTIPLSLRTLAGIQKLDFSRNNLSGPIPEFLAKLSSQQNLNLSFNALEGEVPLQGVFGNASAFSVLGNNKLCGGISNLRLPACPTQTYRNRGKQAAIRIIIPIATVLLLFILLACYFIPRHLIERSKRKKPSSMPSLEMGPIQVSYAELLSATGGFSSSKLIGAGSFGSVYKGENVCDEEIVAVKVLLSTQQHGSGSQIFMHECESLRNIRHRNLIKIITSCSSVDFRGNDFKAMVYEYMPNGNLDKWLHPVLVEGQPQRRNLRLIERLNIAIDVAATLDYLHHHCYEVVVHCNLKPSNVLLVSDMNARVGDFGLARFLPEFMGEVSQDQNISSRAKGSAGYLAPEYGTGAHVSTSGDVYSYGILLLEIFTGMRPTDPRFRDGFTLQNFVKMAFPERVTEVIDPILLPQEEAKDEGNSKIEDSSHASMRVMECLVSVIGTAISCSKEIPRERMGMRDVSAEMRTIRDVFLLVCNDYNMYKKNGK